MAVPSSGQLSLNSIYNELDDDDYAGGTTNSNVSLKNLSDGTVDTINTANDAADRPDGSAPHAMSEFYSYDHSLVTATFDSVFSNFTMADVQGQTVISSAKAITISGGSGNTLPVTPPQGNNGGSGYHQCGSHFSGGGGGGATAVGASKPSGPQPQTPMGNGGAGATTHIPGSPISLAGGGGAGNAYCTGGTGGTGGGGAGNGNNAGSTNTGGGGGGTGSGGSGVVIIRYKYQN